MKRWICLLLAVLFVCGAAWAEGLQKPNLSVQIDGGLKTKWENDGSAGQYAFRLYRNDKLILEKKLSGRCVHYNLPNRYVKAAGDYCVKLTAMRKGEKSATASYCFTVARSEATAKPTAKPSASCGAGSESPTAKPSASCGTCTESPTAKPTAKPTPKPTAQPTANPTSAPASGDAAGEVIRLVNAERAAAGLGALTYDAELTRAACVRAGEIAQSFSHTRPDGTSWSSVSSKAYGENIAMGYPSADRVMAGWMTSEGHRANILRASFGSIGVCATRIGGVTYWVQLFGK